MKIKIQKKIITYSITLLITTFIIIIIFALFGKDESPYYNSSGEEVIVSNETPLEVVKYTDNRPTDKEKPLIEYAKLKAEVYLKLDNFITLINQKRYQEAYDLIDNEYKQDFRYSYNLFKAIYEFDNKKSFSAKLLHQTPDHSRYIYEVQLYDEVLDSPGKNDMWHIKKHFTIFPDGDKYRIADRGILSSENISKEYSSNNINLNLSREVVTSEGIMYKLTIHNTSDLALEIKDESTGIFAQSDTETFYHELIAGSPSDYSLKPNEKKNYTIVFKNAKNITTIVLVLKDRKKIIMK